MITMKRAINTVQAAGIFEFQTWLGFVNFHLSLLYSSCLINACNSGTQWYASSYSYLQSKIYYLAKYRFIIALAIEQKLHTFNKFGYYIWMVEISLISSQWDYHQWFIIPRVHAMKLITGGMDNLFINRYGMSSCDGAISPRNWER